MADYLTDVVIVGSGAAGTLTALAAKERGLEPLIVEATELYGGNSAISGGGVWIPGNHVIARAGLEDSYEKARSYLDACLDRPDQPALPGPAATPARREAFLRHGPEMVQWLEDLGMQWVHATGYSDYYPQLPGGMAQGRGIEAKKFDLNRLGTWKDKLRYSVRGVAIYTWQFNKIAIAKRSVTGFLTAARAFGLESLAPRLAGRDMVGLGNALMGRLLELVLDRTIPIWLSTPLTELVVADGRVTGAVVEREGKTLRVQARRGVMIAAGGFEKSAEMRARHQQAPTDPGWSSGSPGNLGVPILAAQNAGAALVNLDAAWWGPTVLAGATPMFLLQERSLPHGIIVAADGKRFMNESESYVDAGYHQYARNREVAAIPAWHIIDSRHRSRYPYGRTLPGIGTSQLVRSGFLVEARTLRDLAAKIGVDPAGLIGEVERFNGFAARGRDEDFSRGESAYDRVYCDPSVGPNPNLGAISKPPFFAVKVYPGDLGTCGGILTDEHARALRPDGSVIEGLYAAGNSAASLMGYTYPGPGATIGPATVFGYLAGLHMAAEAAR